MIQKCENRERKEENLKFRAKRQTIQNGSLNTNQQTNIETATHNKSERKRKNIQTDIKDETVKRNKE